MRTAASIIPMQLAPVDGDRHRRVAPAGSRTLPALPSTKRLRPSAVKVGHSAAAVGLALVMRLPVGAHNCAKGRLASASQVTYGRCFNARRADHRTCDASTSALVDLLARLISSSKGWRLAHPPARGATAARVRQLGIKAPSFDAFSIAYGALRNTRLPQSFCIGHVKSPVRCTYEATAAENNNGSSQCLSTPSRGPGPLLGSTKLCTAARGVAAAQGA
jgi:hypothetical protein